MEGQKIRIKLKAYEHATLDRTTDDIVKTAKRTGARVIGPIPLPTRRSVYTVLRSPHVNKKSREQFEMRIHKRLIDLTHTTQQTIDDLRWFGCWERGCSRPLAPSIRAIRQDARMKSRRTFNGPAPHRRA